MGLFKALCGLILVCLGFAVFGSAFDVIDIAVRDDWPRPLVFAIMPLFAIAAAIAFFIGAALINSSFGAQTND